MGMTNAVEQDSWTEIAVTVDTKDIESAGDIANMVVPYGIYIEDYSALEEETMEIAHIDLIEESLLEKDRTKGIIHIYINPDENPLESTSFISERLDALGIKYEITISDCKVEDWQNNWKQYFHPMPIGKKLLIRPVWEENYDAGDRKVLDIEPGLAFGSGSHPTTQLCLETLENMLTKTAPCLTSVAVRAFFQSQRFSSVQSRHSALTLTSLLSKLPRRTHSKTALVKIDSPPFRVICPTR